MTCSPARLAANRANALRSSGPKTDETKAISRMNALKHGLSAQVVRTAEDNAAIAEAGPLGEWLDGEVIVLTRRINQARGIEDRERQRAALRAESCWDDDQRIEAERIGAGMARNPGRALARLRGTLHGCLWLIERWTALLQAAGQDGGWNEAQQALADDLRGIPVPLRLKKVDAADQAALASKTIADLQKRRDMLTKTDAFDRESAQLGLSDSATPELRRAIRYEADLHRRLRWCQAQLKSKAAPAPTTPKPLPPPLPSSDDLNFFDEDEDFSDLDALYGVSLPPIPAHFRDALAVSILPQHLTR